MNTVLGYEVNKPVDMLLLIVSKCQTLKYGLLSFLFWKLIIGWLSPLLLCYFPVWWVQNSSRNKGGKFWQVFEHYWKQIHLYICIRCLFYFRYFNCLTYKNCEIVGALKFNSMNHSLMVHRGVLELLYIHRGVLQHQYISY